MPSKSSKIKYKVNKKKTKINKSCKKSKKSKINKKKLKGGSFEDTDVDKYLESHLPDAVFKIIKFTNNPKKNNIIRPFYEIYCKIINDKISEKIKKGKKGNPILLDNPKSIQYLKDPFLNMKKPSEYYKWWLSKINKYSEDTSKWNMIEELQFYFINLFTSIINSYLQFTNNDNYALDELDLLMGNIQIFYLFKTMNIFWETYKKYINWYNIRLSDYDICSDTIPYLDDTINKKYELILPVSLAPSPITFLKLFAAPIYPLISRHKTVHGNFSHPCWHIRHDLIIHLKYIKYNTLYNKSIKIYYKEVSDYLDRFFEKYHLERDKLYYELLFGLIHEPDDLLDHLKTTDLTIHNKNNNFFERIKLQYKYLLDNYENLPDFFNIHREYISNKRIREISKEKITKIFKEWVELITN